MTYLSYAKVNLNIYRIYKSPGRVLGCSAR